MKAIAAMTENRAIGKGNKLPWPSIKEDFKWFKGFTLNKILVVGKTTYWGLPDLPKRKLLVLTRGLGLSYKTGENFWDPLRDLAIYYADFETILELDVAHKGELIVAGGAKTYELFMPYITEFYVTYVRGEYEADVFMPPFEHLFTKKEIVKAFNDKGTVIYPAPYYTEINPESLKDFDGHHVTKYSK